MGFDTTDQALDVLIRPDLSGWDWKDETDFELALDLGLLQRDEGERIRRTLQDRAGELLSEEGRRRLQQWAAWRPLSTWTVPEPNRAAVSLCD